ncbi:Lunapark domain [Trinorchestia longiramus]|nr:Lunapark domain [Trinorchestia longiramus]
MGAILSWFRKTSTKELLREIQEELDSIQDQQRDVELRTRHIGRYVVYSFVLYLLVGLCTYWYWLPRSYNDWLKFSLPFAAFPPLVMMVKRLFHWYYGRQLRNSRGKVEKLKKKKQDILDQVMETETYKVAKEILQQYAPEQLTPVMKMNMVTPPRTNIAPGPPGSTVRRRDPVMVRPTTPAGGVQPVRASTPGPAAPTSLAGGRPGAPTQFGAHRPVGPTPVTDRGLGVHGTPFVPQPGVRHLQGITATPARFAQTPLRGALPYSGGAPGVPMPRPVAPRDRGIMDRLIDYLMKEGPANSYALVCKQCESHNGMALKDDFPYMAYRCAYCHYWNPARKLRPPPPKLEPLVPPPPPPTVSSSSSEVSTEDEDDEENEESGEEATKNLAGASKEKDQASKPDSDQARSSSAEREPSGLVNGSTEVTSREAGQSKDSSKELESEVKISE